MANEKRTSISFAVVKDVLNAQLSGSLNEDLSGTNVISGRFSATTSWAAIPVTGLASVDLIAIKNNDATNFIELAVTNDGTNKFAKITAGRMAFFPPAGSVTLYVKADTAACDYTIVAVEP